MRLPTVADSRRLTGPTLLLDRPGAILDVALDDARRDGAIAGVARRAAPLLDAVELARGDARRPAVRRRRQPRVHRPDRRALRRDRGERGGMGVAAAELDGRVAEPAPDGRRAPARGHRGRAEPGARGAARRRTRAGVTFLADDEPVSVGSGGGALVWPAGALPDPAAVDWSRVHDVPVALVTGSNGKTTAVRLLAAILAGHGLTVGHTSTDGVTVAATARRRRLRRPERRAAAAPPARVEAAVLETARGGILRRGLAVDAPASRWSPTSPTTISASSASTRSTSSPTSSWWWRARSGRRARWCSTRTIRCSSSGPRRSAPVIWFTLDAQRPRWRGTWPRVARGDAATATGSCWPRARRDDARARSTTSRSRSAAPRATTWRTRSRRRPRRVLGVPPDAIGASSALRARGRDNPGRANLVDLGGVRSSSTTRTIRMGWPRWGTMAALPARRRLVLWPGGRPPDGAIRELARAASGSARPGGPEGDGALPARARAGRDAGTHGRRAPGSAWRRRR